MYYFATIYKMLHMVIRFVCRLAENMADAVMEADCWKELAAPDRRTIGGVCPCTSQVFLQKTHFFPGFPPTDFIFTRVMRNKRLCRTLLEMILHVKVGKIRFLTTHHAIESDPIAKGIIMDVFLRDEDKVINVEMQTANHGDLSRRSRYYQAAVRLPELVCEVRGADSPARRHSQDFPEHRRNQTGRP